MRACVRMFVVLTETESDRGRESRWTGWQPFLTVVFSQRLQPTAAERRVMEPQEIREGYLVKKVRITTTTE